MKTIFSLLSISLLTVIMNGCDKSMITPEDNLNGNINEPPTVTVPSTIFVAFQDYNVSNFGDYLTKEFTVNEKTKFVFRFASAYNAQAAIFTDDQLNNFTSLHAFTGYGLFDNQVGTQTVTLNPGTYYLGVRNTTHSENSFSAELDYTYSLPASDRCSFNDVYIQTVKTFSGNGGWIQMNSQFKKDSAIFSMAVMLDLKPILYRQEIYRHFKTDKPLIIILTTMMQQAPVRDFLRSIYPKAIMQ